MIELSCSCLGNNLPGYLSSPPWAESTNSPPLPQCSASTQSCPLGQDFQTSPCTAQHNTSLSWSDMQTLISQCEKEALSPGCFQHFARPFKGPIPTLLTVCLPFSSLDGTMCGPRSPEFSVRLFILIYGLLTGLRQATLRSLGFFFFNQLSESKSALHQI